MSIHVLQLGPYPPPEGGVSRNMLAIRDGLRGRGDRCSIIATSRSSAVSNDADVHHPGGAVEIVKLLASLKYDVLHLHVGGDLNTRVLALAVVAATFAGRKSVLTVHSGAFPLTSAAVNAARFSLHGSVFRRFGAMIAVNDALDDVFQRFGVAKERIHKILPFALSRPDDSVVVPDKFASFYDKHSPVLLSVGGLEPDYDPFFQIKAMEQIVGDHPKAGLVMAGSGSMLREVEAAVAGSSCSENILVAGNVDHAVTLHLIQRADMLLRTTLFDGDAISVREALFLGTPVIATDNGMRPEGTHLIEIGDVDGLVGKVNEILKDRTVRAEHAGENHDNIAAVLDLYDSLLAT